MSTFFRTKYKWKVKFSYCEQLTVTDCHCQQIVDLYYTNIVIVPVSIVGRKQVERWTWQREEFQHNKLGLVIIIHIKIHCLTYSYHLITHNIGHDGAIQPSAIPHCQHWCYCRWGLLLQIPHTVRSVSQSLCLSQLVSSAKMAELTELTFGEQTYTGPRDLVLLYMGTYWHHLAHTTEQSKSSSDAGCQYHYLALYRVTVYCVFQCIRWNCNWIYLKKQITGNKMYH